MQDYHGGIKFWKHEQGFGFIESDTSEKDVFIHIRDINHSGYQPKIGDIVYYNLMFGKDGKTRAHDAYIKGQSIPQSKSKSGLKSNKIRKRKSEPVLPYVVIALIPFVFSAFLIVEQRQVVPFFIYVVMSLLTFLAYAIDKTKAHKDQWRTSEFTLHLVELLGGWPGALIAQKMMRHKNKKTSYQTEFWMIVILHLASWSYFSFVNTAYIETYLGF